MAESVLLPVSFRVNGGLFSKQNSPFLHQKYAATLWITINVHSRRYYWADERNSALHE